MSTYTGSELATKYAAYLIYKGTATPTEINQMTSPKLGYVFDVTANGTITNGNITVVAGDAIVYLAQGWTHMNNGSADQQIAALSAQVTQLISLIGNTDFSRFALKTEIPTVPTKVSAFQNDSGYLTQHQSLAAYQTKANSDAAYVGKLGSLDTTAADGTIVQYTGATTATLTKGHFYIYETGTGWSEINLGNGEGDGIKQKNTLSTAGTEGEIVFYTGTTTEDYTTNNFYKYSNGEWAWVDIPSLTFAYNATSKTLSIEYGEATKEVNINNIIKDNTDGELDNTSENPIQNKVVAEALSDIEEVTDKLTDDLAGLHMEFDTDNLQLVLLDSDDQVIGTANLSTLAKDAMLEDVEIFTEAESGVSVSTPYLKFTFNTDAGTQPIRVPLTDFVINVNTDTVLSPVSTNPVQNKVIYEAIQALQTAINNITGTPDAALSPTSIKPVQNRVITNELNGVKDRVAALEGSGINYKYFKQVENLDTYQAEDGEIVEYIGSTNSKYTHGYIYQRKLITVPDNSYLVKQNPYGIDEGIYTYDDTIVNINSIISTYQQYDNGALTEDKYYLGTDPACAQIGDYIWNDNLDIFTIVDFTAIQGQYYPQITLNNGVFIRYKGAFQQSATAFKNNQNTIYKQGLYYKNELIGNSIRTLEGYNYVILLPIGHAFGNGELYVMGETISEWVQTNVQPQKDTSTIESDIAALQTGKANEVTSFTESSTRTNIASGDTVTTIWGKVKKWFSDLKAVAFSGSYNDLSNKPLSLENNKVKYSPDGETKLTLTQEDDVKNIPITFTPDTSAVRANIQSGDTLARMAQVINNNFGNYSINNSSFEFSSFVTESNLYGRFLSGLGILIICGWFRVVTTNIERLSNILRFKGYTPDAAYPKFIDENSNNSIVLRTGESGRGEWWLFAYRSSMSNLFWEGLPTVITVKETS